jgi:hypothetical protein
MGRLRVGRRRAGRVVRRHAAGQQSCPGAVADPARVDQSPHVPASQLLTPRNTECANRHPDVRNDSDRELPDWDDPNAFEAHIERE